MEPYSSFLSKRTEREMTYFVIILFFCGALQSKCIDTFNVTYNGESYMIYCPNYLPVIIPTSCNCGILPLFSFSSTEYPGSLECFCNGKTINGYARAFCCDELSLNTRQSDPEINKNIKSLRV